MVEKWYMWFILEPLICSEEPLHLAEISKRVGVPHSTLKRYLEFMEKLGIVNKKKIGRQVFFSLRKNAFVIDYLVMAEKERLLKKCEEDLLMREIVNFLRENYDNDILIFGSAVDSVRSARDVDVMVVGRFHKKKLEELENKLNIEIHVTNPHTLKEVGGVLKKEIRKRHLIVQGSERLIKWMIR